MLTSRPVSDGYSFRLDADSSSTYSDSSSSVYKQRIDSLFRPAAAAAAAAAAVSSSHSDYEPVEAPPERRQPPPPPPPPPPRANAAALWSAPAAGPGGTGAGPLVPAAAAASGGGGGAGGHMGRGAEVTVEYLGAVQVPDGATRLQQLQQPLKRLYAPWLRRRGTAPLRDSLQISDTGLRVRYGRGQELFNPFTTVAVWAAVKFVASRAGSDGRLRFGFLPLICDPESPDRGRLLEDGDGTLPADAPAARHPPLLACVMRRPGTLGALECHGFVCAAAEDAIVIAANLYQALLLRMQPESGGGSSGGGGGPPGGPRADAPVLVSGSGGSGSEDGPARRPRRRRAPPPPPPGPPSRQSAVRRSTRGAPERHRSHSKSRSRDHSLESVPSREHSRDSVPSRDHSRDSIPSREHSLESVPSRSDSRDSERRHNLNRDRSRESVRRREFQRSSSRESMRRREFQRGGSRDSQRRREELSPDRSRESVRRRQFQRSASRESVRGREAAEAAVAVPPRRRTGSVGAAPAGLAALTAAAAAASPRRGGGARLTRSSSDPSRSALQQVTSASADQRHPPLAPDPAVDLGRLLAQLQRRDGIRTVDDVLRRVIAPGGMSFSELRPEHRELLLRLALTLSKDEMYQRSKSIMKKQTRKGALFSGGDSSENSTSDGNSTISNVLKATKKSLSRLGWRSGGFQSPSAYLKQHTPFGKLYNARANSKQKDNAKSLADEFPSQIPAGAAAEDDSAPGRPRRRQRPRSPDSPERCDCGRGPAPTRIGSLRDRGAHGPSARSLLALPAACDADSCSGSDRCYCSMDRRDANRGGDSGSVERRRSSTTDLTAEGGVRRRRPDAASADSSGGSSGGRGQRRHHSSRAASLSRADSADTGIGSAADDAGSGSGGGRFLVVSAADEAGRVLRRGGSQRRRAQDVLTLKKSTEIAATFSGLRLSQTTDLLTSDGDGDDGDQTDTRPRHGYSDQDIEDSLGYLP